MNARISRLGSQPLVLITGGAGFIGTNLAHRFLGEGTPVLVLDNLSRPGVEHNLQWLCDTHGSLARFELADVRNPGAVRQAMARASHVFHFAAQVAVTHSITDPQKDFDVNARGTLNVLEAIRACPTPPTLVFTSTNKVYGALDDLVLHEGDRFWPVDAQIAKTGIGEGRRLDFHTPYGCSKGTPDQYVLDFARTYGIPAVVFRMSCIYGLHQCGNEDQGWLAHFVRQTLADEPIVIYGCGRQVRDVLFVEDLVEAMRLAQARMDDLAGQAFNIGGGPAHTTSLNELLDLLASLHGRRPPVSHAAARSGDQRYYVSDIRRFQAATGWQPRVSLAEGVERLVTWMRDEQPRAPLAFRQVAT